ncbi:unnamed protein product, partial [Mesorhabditis belari]|uniref:MIF4G domain-containing protein n=1 Tax=Mesorhabditis belari TaxID=2138241 RepID=A0AAF3F6E2_9BILA
MQEQIQDKAGEQLQRLNWERLKKKIHGLVNKVNASNLVGIVRELLPENIIRGKGLLTGSIIQAQAHELLALEIMLLMLKTPTEDSVEGCIAFLEECGAKLTEIAPRALDNVFSRLRNILAEAQLDSRIRYMIETAMAIRRDKFATTQL